MRRLVTDVSSDLHCLQSYLYWLVWIKGLRCLYFNRRSVSEWVRTVSLVIPIPFGTFSVFSGHRNVLFTELDIEFRMWRPLSVFILGHPFMSHGLFHLNYLQAHFQSKGAWFVLIITDIPTINSNCVYPDQLCTM